MPEKVRRIITSDEFGRLYEALASDDYRLLVETDIESGLRWGELTELRARDLNMTTRILTVGRAVVEINSSEHPSGGKFLVKDYPKDKEYRRIPDCAVGLPTADETALEALSRIRSTPIARSA